MNKYLLEGKTFIVKLNHCFSKYFDITSVVPLWIIIYANDIAELFQFAKNKDVCF